MTVNLGVKPAPSSAAKLASFTLRIVLLAFGAAALLASCPWAAVPTNAATPVAAASPTSPTPAAPQWSLRVAALLKQMTLEEKIGQMRQITNAASYFTLRVSNQKRRFRYAGDTAQVPTLQRTTTGSSSGR